ncbi:prepilin-type N-terminal cleavage/methylation domain-containing protein, partial [Candidatus Babeliales bacterium]|nr:prepilin-type N-terminal cleavage/methylation domain-containing protein [Candidatus Babeliales bacterium]
MSKKQGFSLLELMVVVAIVALLSMIATPSFMRYLAKAKRAEAFMNLGSLYTAEKVYWAEHGIFTDKLCGSCGAGWKPEGYSGGGEKERFYYSYGFCHGKEGEQFFTGKLGAHLSEIKQSRLNPQSF